ncbi:MAG: hypothetical protein HYY00_06950 [Chloroflexi bacterium]|nr:hypothetical protein [Chloroflexota bacterium]
MRQLFDAMQIFDKVREGYFSARLFWQSKGTPSHLERGSASQMWEYVSPRGIVFARVHEYRDSRGNIIGRPDPKYFRIDQVTLFVQR